MLDEMPSIDTDPVDRSARVHTTLQQVVPHTETGSRFDSSPRPAPCGADDENRHCELEQTTKRCAVRP
jgi:hypothetical protein